MWAASFVVEGDSYNDHGIHAQWGPDKWAGGTQYLWGWSQVEITYYCHEGF